MVRSRPDRIERAKGAPKRTGLVLGLAAAILVAGVAALLARGRGDPLKTGGDGASPSRSGRTGEPAPARLQAAPSTVAAGNLSAAAVGDAALERGPYGPLETTFGPHIRDLALTAGGSLAVANTMNWDHNLYAVDTATGRTRWRGRAGHYFAFAPTAIRDGVAVQGFDFRSAEGYHLYLVGADGRLERRFALYGLPRRLIHRFVPGIVRDRVSNFAVPKDASWVASAGDLGLAVWKAGGELLWKQDWWKTERRLGERTPALAALDARTLVVAEAMRVSGYRAGTGDLLWRHDLAPTGEVTRIVVNRETETCALLSTFEGGRVHFIRKGRPAGELATPANDLAFDADGARVAVVHENQLKLYSVESGLQWIFSGEDMLRFPRFSPSRPDEAAGPNGPGRADTAVVPTAPEGGRIACSSDLGSVYVLDPDGELLFERDMGAKPVPVWLPGGDLLLGTWMGTLCRLDGQFKERWRTVLEPEAVDVTGKLLTDDKAPTTRISDWTEAEETPRPITDNLLGPRRPDNVVDPTGPRRKEVGTKTWAAIEFVPSSDWGGRARLLHDPGLLSDGENHPPPSPWLGWSNVSMFAGPSKFNYLLIDTIRVRLRVTGVTFFEDPAHPESWLREVRFEYWDVEREEWVFVKELLSDAPVHTHMFGLPVEAARFRLVFPWGLVGNLRLAEIAFHGEKLGSSHPDAARKLPVAVLFDEQDDIKMSMIYGNNGLKFGFDGAFSGGRFLELRKDAKVAPRYERYGHTIPNWDFEIVENPGPGQYRHLQFAWKALSPRTRGITLGIGGTSFHAGEVSGAGHGGGEPHGVRDAPPREWTVERVDLWSVTPRPRRILGMSLACKGGPAAFDRILLGRTEQDLAARGGSREAVETPGRFGRTRPNTREWLQQVPFCHSLLCSSFAILEGCGRCR